jgi:hypothetical protein
MVGAASEMVGAASEMVGAASERVGQPPIGWGHCGKLGFVLAIKIQILDFHSSLDP